MQNYLLKFSLIIINRVVHFQLNLISFVLCTLVYNYRRVLVLVTELAVLPIIADISRHVYGTFDRSR